MSRPRRSSRGWRERQERDPYVKRARKEGRRSRAVYKLEEIDAREKLLSAGMRVLDLGAAPGGWSQYVIERLRGKASIVAVDLLPMDPLPGVDILQADIGGETLPERLRERFGGEPADLVLSDMAPNITGTKAIDQPRAMHLAELALDTALRLLKPGGSFVCKLFQGEGTDAFVAEARQHFGKVRIMKPRASRSGSNEVYLVARNYRL